MLQPLPDFTNAESMAELGRHYVMRERWLEAVKVLRDSVSEIQSTNEMAQALGLEHAEEAVTRLKHLKRIAA